MDKKLVVLTLLLLGLIGTSASGDLRDGLVGWWRFEGNFNDSAGANHGNAMGDARIVTDAERGRVVEFDGNGDYVEVPNSPSLNITGNQITMTAWVCHDDVTGNPEIIIAKVFNNATHSSPYFSYGLHILNPSGHPRVWISRTGGASNAANAARLLTSGKWHHLAGVYDGAQLRLYLDGAQVASANVTGNLIGYDTPLLFGINGGRGEPMDGKLDEVRIYNRALSDEEVVAVMAGAGGGIEQAADPSPAAEAVDVPVDAALSWAPGEFAATHDVYLGTTFADANDATRANPMDVLASQSQADATYAPSSPLEFGRTYFWRIDEVNAAPDNTIFKGEVWSFTTEPYAYPLTDVTATASGSQVGTSPEKTIDGSGLSAGGEHSTELTDMWMGGALPSWIQYEFDKVYKLHEMAVWNSNQLVEAFVGFGAKGVTVEYSVDGATWTALEGVPEFARATGTATYTANTVVDFGGVMAKFVRLTIASNWGGVAPQTGLSEVRFFHVPVAARQPKPAPGATDIQPQVTLSWRPGREAASHEVYLGTDRQAVADGSTPPIAVPQSSLDVAADLAQSYFWKVVEVNEARTPASWEGDVWDFSTVESLVVDDFESYTNDSPKRVFQAWIDGLGFSADEFFPKGNSGNGTGSLIGYDPAAGNIMETTLIYGGEQSMPMIYDGPRSEAERTFDPPQDWSQHGITTLVLFFRGDAANDGAPIYVKINGTKLLYNNGAASTATALWKQWNIDLSSLGASLKSVETLTIGVGDGSSSASGTIFLDEIRLYATPPEAVAPTDPGQNGLAAWWGFEGDFKDSAGTNHGTPKGDAKIVADAQRGQVLELDGTGDYVEVPNSPSLNITGDKVALSAWANFNSVATVQMIVCKVFSNTTHATPYFSYGLHTLANGQPRVWISRTGGAAFQAGATGMFKAGTWHHVAGVYDGAQLKLYFDGALAGTSNVTGNLIGYDTVLRLGANGVLMEMLAGRLDDVRIYNRPLSEGEIRYLAGDR